MRFVAIHRWAPALLIALPLGAQPRAGASTPVRPKGPRLVLTIIVDQFRYDYLTRFRSEFTGGLKRLLEQGAVFTNARYPQFPTLTAVGHSTILTGATPAMSGIVSNEWWDQKTHEHVTSVSDDTVTLLGASGAGASPRRLLQSTLGDELKISGKGDKVIGVSLKDRSAILPSGHMADGAYWFDARSGNIVSSTYYFPELPKWAEEFDGSAPAGKYTGREWLGHKMPAQTGASYYSELDYSPWGNELVEQFALRALAAEHLGTGLKIDLMTVSFSANDYIGHRYGPDSPEARDAVLRVDKLIGELIGAAETQVGAGNVVVLFTADHGVAPVPQVNQQRKMPGGRLNINGMKDAVEKTLTDRFGAGPWVAEVSPAGTYLGVYLNLDSIAAHKLDDGQAESVAADALRAMPGIFRVFTNAQLRNGGILEDPVGVAVRNGFYASRSPELIFVPQPYWVVAATGTGHATPFDYDTHVPLIFLGPGIAAGRYNRNVAVNDAAPTLATLLEVETPSGSVGSVLAEILK